MSSIAWSWALAITGTLASLAGVVFSWMAWVQAGRAKDAAQEARDLVKKRDVSHELTALAGDARELLTAVRELQDQKAANIAIDLVHELSIMKGRRAEQLPPRSGEEIDTMIRALNLVLRALEKPEVPDFDRISIVKSCQKIHRRVCEIAGSAERNAEDV